MVNRSPRPDTNKSGLATRVRADERKRHMSKRNDMIARIKSAMPDDAEVQEWCDKELNRSAAQAEKTSGRLDALRIALREVRDEHGDGFAVTAKMAASYVNELVAPLDGEWNCRTASYYLRKLVSCGECVEVAVAKNAPKEYSFVG